MRTASPLVLAVVVAGSAFGVTASEQAESETAESLLQRATVLFEARQFHEALETFDLAIRAGEGPQVVQARIGKIRSALRVAEFGVALRDGEALRAEAAEDPEALAVYGDTLWAAGLFDEADEAYAEALRLVPDAPRARFGRARSLATMGRAEEALREALAASADAPEDA
jgi:tetratricopeptide (TPR) repeat protein